MSELNTVTPAQHTPSQYSTTLMPQLHNTSLLWLKHSPHSYHIQWQWVNSETFHPITDEETSNYTVQREEKNAKGVGWRRIEDMISVWIMDSVLIFHWMIHYNSAFQWWLIIVSLRYLVFISLWCESCKAVHSSGIMFDMFCCHRNRYYDHDSRTGGIHKLCVLTSIRSYQRATKSFKKIENY